MVSVVRYIDLCLDRHYPAELGLDFTVLLFTMMCDVWVAICQPFVKRIYDDDDDKGRTLVIVPLCRQALPQRRSGTWRAPSSVAHTCLISYTFPAIAGTHLPTSKGWRVE